MELCFHIINFLCYFTISRPDGTSLPQQYSLGPFYDPVESCLVDMVNEVCTYYVIMHAAARNPNPLWFDHY